MKLSIMQPYLFPYFGYFQLINAADKHVIYDDVQYIKGGWINRNNILIGKNKTLFTIKLDGASPNKLINEIDIKDDFTKFLKTVAMAYSQAPYKDPVFNLISMICAYEDKNLARFIGNSLQEISNYLGIKTKFMYSSDLKKDNDLRAQDKVISICEELGADVYINAIGGQGLYNREKFKNHGIELRFINSLMSPYKQFNNEFIPSLSIIDVMMFNSKDNVIKILNEYELI